MGEEVTLMRRRGGRLDYCDGFEAISIMPRRVLGDRDGEE